MQKIKWKMSKKSTCGIFLKYNSQKFRRRWLTTKTRVRTSSFKHSVSSDWPIGSDHPSVESCITSQVITFDVIMKFQIHRNQPVTSYGRTDGQHVWDSPFHAVIFTPLECSNFRSFLNARFVSHAVTLVTNIYGLVPSLKVICDIQSRQQYIH
jgi:hypothetical protein